MIEILTGDCRSVLATLLANSIHCCVTSPPYFGLRDYGTAQWTGGDPACAHEGDKRFQTAASASSDAFSEAGEDNAARLKKARWREGGTCRCGAVHSDPQIGLEKTPDEFVAQLVTVFREVRRVLRDDGTLWLNLGDSYAGSWGAQGRRGPESKNAYDASVISRNQIANHPKTARNTGSIKQDGLKPKDLIGIPWRVAFALQADGWYLRQDIIWSKPNPMPESVTDRCTKAHEYLFLLSKSPRYFYDSDAIAEPAAYAPGCGWEEEPKGTRGGKRGVPQERAIDPEQSFRAIRETRNKRSVWTVATQSYSDAHFATFPPALVEPCILAGCPEGGAVLDPFGGAGTTGLVADRLRRNAVLIELNPGYADMARRRIQSDAPLFFEAAQ